MIGKWKKFGEYGPVYQVLSIAGEDPEQGIMVHIRVLESGELTALPYNDVMNDPDAD